MKQYVCTICGYLYDEAKGIPEAGIAPGTKWEDLPAGWKCPLCGADKSAFREVGSQAPVTEDHTPEAPFVQQELAPMELSIICSNLARACEKQYMPQQEAEFRRLAEFFRSKAEPVRDADIRHLLELVEGDLAEKYPYGMAVSASDRGALRSQVWSEKVTRMLKALLTRYQQEGEAMLEHTGVFVCSVCGFIYVGDEAPEICPVCKVPSWKFDRVYRRE